MGKVEELPIDERGRLQLSRDVRRKLGIKGKGKVKVKIEDGGVRLTPPIPREQFIEYMDGFIKEGEPPMDPKRLKEIWEQRHE